MAFPSPRGTPATSPPVSAAKRELPSDKRKGVDACADYLIAKRSMLRYDQYLRQGLPIATGVIEGACRHLIVDRLDITGARRSVRGAEAILRLRSLRSSGDFDDYWRFHLQAEHQKEPRLPLCQEADAQAHRSRSVGLEEPRPIDFARLHLDGSARWREW